MRWSTKQSLYTAGGYVVAILMAIFVVALIWMFYDSGVIDPDCIFYKCIKIK